MLYRGAVADYCISCLGWCRAENSLPILRQLEKVRCAVILRGSDFGHVFTAPGERGFFMDDGYWHHRFWCWLGLDFRGATFIAKTTTLRGWLGPMLHQEIHWRNGVVLSTVDVHGPGAQLLLKRRRWQMSTEPLFLSFAAVGETADARAEEYGAFADLLRRYLPDFQAPVGLQVDFSCLNVDGRMERVVCEADVVLSTLGELSIPLIPRFSVLVPVKFARYVSGHPSCDAIALSNAIPWGQCPNCIDWEGLFGTEESPLAAYGDGMLSGAPLFPIVREWIVSARAAGTEKPIIAGGGVQRPEQAEQLLDLGASAIELGDVCLLRPWRVARIIEAVHDAVRKLNITDPHYRVLRRTVLPLEPEREDRVLVAK